MKKNKIEKLARVWLNSEKRVVLTGAGASVPSGIPDFRGPQGLWRKMDPNLFSLDYFYENPQHAWELFIQLFRMLRRASPNTIHRVLSILEKRGLVDAIITQNIDSLHQKAGSRRVLELHGNAFRTRCLKCGALLPTIKVVEDIIGGGKPFHRECGGLLKPDIVYFGEQLPPDVLEEAFRLSTQSDFFLVIGSSLTIQPASLLPLIAKDNGAYLAIINLGPTELDDLADMKIEEDASIVMQFLYEKMFK